MSSDWRVNISETVAPKTFYQRLMGGGAVSNLIISAVVVFVITVIVLCLFRPPIVVWRSKKDDVNVAPSLKPIALVSWGFLSAVFVILLMKYG